MLTCWVCHIILWRQATENRIIILDVNNIIGCKVIDGKLEYDWEFDEHKAAVQKRFGLLLRGCSYYSRVTACTNRKCGCVKKVMKCSAGCHCKNCGNMQVDDSPCVRQLPCEEQVIEEELLFDLQLRSMEGDMFIHVDEEELLNDAVLVLAG